MDHSKSVSNPNPAVQIVDPSRVLIIASTNARQMGVAVQNMLGPFGQDQSPGAAFQKVLVVEDVQEFLLSVVTPVILTAQMANK